MVNAEMIRDSIGLIIKTIDIIGDGLRLRDLVRVGMPQAYPTDQHAPVHATDKGLLMLMWLTMISS